MNPFIEVAWMMLTGSIPFDLAIVAGIVLVAARDRQRGQGRGPR